MWERRYKDKVCGKTKNEEGKKKNQNQNLGRKIETDSQDIEVNEIN